MSAGCFFVLHLNYMPRGVKHVNAVMTRPGVWYQSLCKPLVICVLQLVRLSERDMLLRGRAPLGETGRSPFAVCVGMYSCTWNTSLA